jgi:hypothetical protein
MLNLIQIFYFLRQKLNEFLRNINHSNINLNLHLRK